MIKPEIGMPVLFVDYDQVVIPATISYVYPGEACVRIITAAGVARDSVLLHQGADGEPSPAGGYWCQFPNWFLRLMAPPAFVYNIPQISPEELARMRPTGPWQVVELLAPHQIHVVPRGTADPVQCGDVQLTSQVQG